MIFCEAGEAGAHQLYNHTEEPCIFLDVRTFIGYDVCDYPDSDKILLAPSFETFGKDAGLDYFAGEENIREIWAQLEQKKETKKGAEKEIGIKPERGTEKKSEKRSGKKQEKDRRKSREKSE